jgi:sulfate transport system permease protein
VTQVVIAPVPDLPPAPRRIRRGRPGGIGLGVGVATIYLSLIVLIPLAAIVARSDSGGFDTFRAAISSREARSALVFTVVVSAIVAAINAVAGTLIAWVLVRDNFPGKRLIDTIIDLPFALPTIVAGLILLALYGQHSPVGVNLAYKRTGVLAALLFVTLPFVVRTVQPVLIEFDQEMEQAAASLGANRATIFRRIVLPNLAPAIAAGTALSFARALGEFGSTVLISGNIPFKTQVAAVHIFGQIESDNTVGAAAVSTVLLVVALIVLVGIDRIQRLAVRRG